MEVVPVVIVNELIISYVICAYVIPVLHHLIVVYCVAYLVCIPILYCF